MEAECLRQNCENLQRRIDLLIETNSTINHKLEEQLELNQNLKKKDTSTIEHLEA